MKPTVLFVYDHKKPEWWLDGLSQALVELENDFEIIKCNIRQDTLSISDHDFVLGWGGFNSPVDNLLQEIKSLDDIDVPFGLCIGGNAYPPKNTDTYDVLFYETDWYKKFIKHHKNIRKAFGVNTDIYFEPQYSRPIIFDYLGVGSFSLWKRWEKMINKTGNRLIIGEYQLDNEVESLGIISDLLKGGVCVSPMVHPFELANYYQWSRTLYIPADINGGGERAILEARSCGLSIEIEDDNPKLKELINSPIPSHIDYANALKEGILSCI